jgi:hypothetical protein
MAQVCWFALFDDIALPQQEPAFLRITFHCCLKRRAGDLGIAIE